MASNKIKAFALTSAIAMAAVIGSTSLAEAARYCRSHYGWHRHCGSYWGYSYRPARYVRCYRPGYYGSAWNSAGYYGYNSPGYYGYGGGGLLGAGTGLLGAGLFGWW